MRVLGSACSVTHPIRDTRSQLTSGWSQCVKCQCLWQPYSCMVARMADALAGLADSADFSSRHAESRPIAFIRPTNDVSWKVRRIRSTVAGIGDTRGRSRSGSKVSRSTSSGVEAYGVLQLSPTTGSWASTGTAMESIVIVGALARACFFGEVALARVGEVPRRAGVSFSAGSGLVERNTTRTAACDSIG